MIDMNVYGVIQENCPFDINQTLTCFSRQQTYLQCQKLPIIVYVAIAGLVLLIIIDVILLIKLNRQRKKIIALGQKPEY